MNIDDTFKAPAAAGKAAARGLALRQALAPSRRAGTPVGIARARDLAAGKSLSMKTIKRMKAYFDRHQIDKKASGWKPSEEGYPSKGFQAWLLWGGDPGYRWAMSKVAQFYRAKKKHSQ